ncbi:MAG: DNA-binding domain-containing protein [Variovorax sp.]
MTSTPRAAYQAGFAAALLDPALPCPPALRTREGANLGERFAVYRNNVMSSLIDALAGTFPVTQTLVGPEFFRAMAAVFVRRSPPTGRVLAFYGREFSDFVRSFEPARSVPYLADVAQLEMARVEAYHAADADPVAPDEVRAALATGEDVAHVRAVLHPSVQIVASRHAVVSIWNAHQTEGEIDLSSIDIAQPQEALVCRESLDAVVLLLPPGAAGFIGRLEAGAGLGDAAAIALSVDPGLDVSAVLAMLFAHGAVVAMKTRLEAAQ